MTYSLILHNSTGSPIDASDGKRIGTGDTWKADKLGTAYFHSDEVGSLSFRDLGQEHIGGDSPESWGVLITYQGAHMVGRYEGGGRLEITWDKHLQAVVGGKMNLRHVKLDPLTTKTELAPAKP
jgi:hypothetical protein